MKVKRRVVVKHIAVSLAGLAFAKNGLAFAGPLLRHKGKPSVVINSGVGGDNTNDLLKRIDSDCLHYKPDLTIVMAGTNDMNSVKYIPLEQYRINLQNIVLQIKASGSKVLLMTILPAYEPYLFTRHPAAFYQPEGVAARRSAVNNVIREIAAAQKLHLLDIGGIVDAVGKIGLDKDSLIQNEANTNKTDGIHPTPNGYRFMGLAVYDRIINLKLNGGKIVCFGDSITKGDGSVDKESYPAYLANLLSADLHS